MTAPVDADIAHVEAAFDEAATEIEKFVDECISKSYSALVVFGILEAHRYALRWAAPRDPTSAMADMLGRAEAERGKGLGRITRSMRGAVRPPSANETVEDPSSGFRSVDHQFTEGLIRLDGTIERLITKHAESELHPLPFLAAVVMWTELLRRVLKEGGTSWWALKKTVWSAHQASEQMLSSARAPS